MLIVDEVQQLRDEALIERLSLSVRNDRRLAVRMLVEMGEVLARGLYRDLGFPTMFEFATRRLGMSEAEAALRIRAAKVGRSFPVALEMLGRCEVNLTTLSMLATVLTEESIHLLHAARFKSKQQVLALIAAHAPKPDVPDSVRRLPPLRASVRAQRVEGATRAPDRPRNVHSSTNQVVPMESAQAVTLVPHSAAADATVAAGGDGGCAAQRRAAQDLLHGQPARPGSVAGSAGFAPGSLSRWRSRVAVRTGARVTRRRGDEAEVRSHGKSACQRTEAFS
jgi:hypothetical protein